VETENALEGSYVRFFVAFLRWRFQYTSWDNLLGTDYEEEEEAQKELASAPKTLRDGDELVSAFDLVLCVVSQSVRWCMH
jgi:hypothetical protein